MKQKIAIITPVPEMIDSYINNSITRKAVEKDIVDLKIYNLRNYSKGKYRQIDDTPFGGGPGMVMMAEPLFRALDDIIEKFEGTEGLKVLFPSPRVSYGSKKLLKTLPSWKS